MRLARVRSIKFIATAVAVSILLTALGGTGLAQAHESYSGRTGAHGRSSATCQGDQFGGYMNIHTPQVYAVNSTSRIDVQNVAFRARVQRYEGGAWVNRYFTNWIYGQARDDMPVAFWKNGNNNSQNYFSVDGMGQGSGAWRAVGEIYWYATSYVGSGSDLAVSLHTSPPAQGTYWWCSF